MLRRAFLLCRRRVHISVLTRGPQPAWLRAVNGGYEIELVGGEEGVSPGQACVFYDAADGQARVLGGGFIKSAAPKPSVGIPVGDVNVQQPLVAALRI